jgi:hypothetical protein
VQRARGSLVSAECVNPGDAGWYRTAASHAGQPPTDARVHGPARLMETPVACAATRRFNGVSQTVRTLTPVLEKEIS